MEPSFSRTNHICAPKPDENALVQMAELRGMLEGSEFYDEEWATDEQLHRCLIAKQFDMKVAYNLCIEALKWRQKRMPHLIETKEDWQAPFSKECETGKIYYPGFDRWGRPVVCFDNSAQNTTNVDDQMLYLGWLLNFSCREMPENVDKYTIFMHLTTFSFFSIPSMSSTTETIHMLCNTFPERLGHCIAYRPPGVFRTFFNSVKSFIDPKTAAKMVFITGDVSDGSKNDLLLKEIIGDNWKVLTGAEQPVLQQTNPPSSPGYNHSVMWPALMKRVEILRQKEAAIKAQLVVSPVVQPSKKLLSNKLESKVKLPENEITKPIDRNVSHNSDQGSSIIDSSSNVTKSKKNHGMLVEVFAAILDYIHYVFNDMFEFKLYLITLLETYLGPSTNPTKLFLRIAIFSYTVLHSDENTKLRLFMYLFIVSFLFLYFLFGDLSNSKRSVMQYISKVSLDNDD